MTYMLGNKESNTSKEINIKLDDKKEIPSLSDFFSEGADCLKRKRSLTCLV